MGMLAHASLEPLFWNTFADLNESLCTQHAEAHQAMTDEVQLKYAAEDGNLVGQLFLTKIVTNSLLHALAPDSLRC